MAEIVWATLKTLTKGSMQCIYSLNRSKLTKTIIKEYCIFYAFVHVMLI